MSMLIIYGAFALAGAIVQGYIKNDIHRRLVVILIGAWGGQMIAQSDYEWLSIEGFAIHSFWLVVLFIALRPQKPERGDE